MQRPKGYEACTAGLLSDVLYLWNESKSQTKSCLSHRGHWCKTKALETATFWHSYFVIKDFIYEKTKYKTWDTLCVCVHTSSLLLLTAPLCHPFCHRGPSSIWPSFTQYSPQALHSHTLICGCIVFPPPLHHHLRLLSRSSPLRSNPFLAGNRSGNID